MCRPVQRNLCGECEMCINRSFYVCKLRHLSPLTDDEVKKIHLKCNVKGIFYHDKCNHYWETPYSVIARGDGCPYCCTPTKSICEKPDCGHCIKKSFVSSPARYLSKLTDAELRKISLSSTKKGIFYCDKCPHSWETSYASITAGTRCKYCANNILCGKKECDICLKKSFLSSPFRHLSKKSDDELRIITLYCTRLKDTFYCDKCPHSWKTTYAHISSGNNCPYCDTRTPKLCGKMECDFCVKKSFLMSPNRNMCTLSDEKLCGISICAGKKGPFKCLKCKHQWKAVFQDVHKGRGCPICVLKTQALVYDFLKENYDCDVENEKKFEWCKKSRFDIVIKKFIVEIDGPQHFRPLKFFNQTQSFEEIQEKDRLKMRKLFKHGYRIIRLNQEDVLFNRIHWQEMLEKALKTRKPFQIICKDSKCYNYLQEFL